MEELIERYKKILFIFIIAMIIIPIATKFIIKNQIESLNESNTGVSQQEMNDLIEQGEKFKTEQEEQLIEQQINQEEQVQNERTTVRNEELD